MPAPEGRSRPPGGVTVCASSQRWRRPRPLTHRTREFLPHNAKHSSKTRAPTGRGRGGLGEEEGKQRSRAEQRVAALRRAPISAEGEGEKGGGRAGRRGGKRKERGGGGKAGRREGEEKEGGKKREEMEGGKDPRTQRALHSPVLYTCSSSTIPSLPPPNTTMSSLMATARWPWRGRGTGPDQPTTRFQRGCRSTAGELAGDTAEAIVPGKAVVGKSHQARRESPNSSHTHPLSSKVALTEKRFLTQRWTAPWRPPS